MSDSDNNKIEIKVFDTAGLCFVFKVKKTQPIILLMKEFCKRRNLEMTLCRFRLDGAPIQPYDEHGNPNTAETLDIQDGDFLDVFQEQEGGLLQH